MIVTLAVKVTLLIAVLAVGLVLRLKRRRRDRQLEEITNQAAKDIAAYWARSDQAVEPSKGGIRCTPDMARSIDVISRVWVPALRDLVKPPCACAAADSQLGAVIVHLNDDHYWTRERIADWLDVIHDPDALDLRLMNRGVAS